MAIIERKKINSDTPRYIVTYNKKLSDTEFVCDTAEEAAYIANKLTYDFFFKLIVIDGSIEGNKITFDLGDNSAWIEDYLTFFTKEVVEDITADDDDGGNELIYIKKITY